MPYFTNRGIVPLEIAPAGLTSGLVAFWELETTGLLDSVASHTLTYQNGSPSVGATTLGCGGNSLNIASGGDINESASSASSDFNIVGNDFSISLWFKVTDRSTANQGIMSYGIDWFSTNRWRLLCQANSTNNDLKFQLYDVSASTDDCLLWDAGADGPFSNGTFYHAVATVDRGAAEIRGYINGTLTGGPTTITVTSGTDTTPTIRLANAVTCSMAQTGGSLDQVGYWSRALTAGEVTQLYAIGNGLRYASM